MFINGYSSLKLRIPDCHSDSDLWAAEVILNASNMADLFPYINAQNNQAKYFENPHYIQFVFEEKRCALYEDKLIIAPFKDRESTIDFIDKLIEYLNDLHEIRSTIQPKHDKYSTIPVLEILKKLPRTNCKKCGFESCTAFAAFVSKRENEILECPDLSR
jgi:ArsR family metal-binding transcriptional regulator